MSNTNKNGTHCGRPKKSPDEKMSTPVRALVTPRVADAISQAAELNCLTHSDDSKNVSNLLRLYILRGLDRDGLLTPELSSDPTWNMIAPKDY